MTSMRHGYYDLEGNTVIYEGGNEAFDIDSNDYIPVEMLIALGTFERALDGDDEV